MAGKREYKQFHIGFSEEEWREVLRKSSKLQLRPGTYIRRISVQGEMKFYDMREMNQIKKAFRMIGTEMNQIAKKVNTTNTVTENDVAEMQKQMDLLEEIVRNHLAEIKPKVL